MRKITFFSQAIVVFALLLLTPFCSIHAQTTLFTEDFETADIGQTPPAGWGVDLVWGGNNVWFQSTGSWPTCSPASGSRMVEFQSFNCGAGTENRLRRTTPVSTVGYTDVTIDFAWLTDPGYAGVSDRVNVQYSTNGSTWTTAATVNRYGTTQAWTTQTVSLPAGAAGVATLYIAFDFISAYGNNCHLDLVQIKAIGPPLPQTVTVGTGTVSCNYPYTTYWMGGRTQLLYTAEWLTAAGALPGQITSLCFNVNSYSNQTMVNFNLNMTNTAMTTLPGWVTGMQNCYSGAYAVPGNGWQLITLSTPFIWNGQNLIVEVCFGNNGAFSNYSYVYGTDAPAGQIEPYWMDNTVGCTYTGAPFTGYASLPNLRFVEVPYVGTLAGTVTSCSNGAPLAGITVTCGTVSGTTNAAGAYTLYNVPVGNYTATYTLSGFLPGSAPVVINNGQTTSKNICLNPVPGVLAGVVTSAATGNPIMGAIITVGTSFGYSTGPNGAYYVNVYPVGTFSASCSKPGFDNATAGPFTFTQYNMITQNFALLENVNAPGSVAAALNAGETAVNINWGLPNGNYELLYDDGIQEGFQVWAFAGSYNAVKFTAPGYPCSLNGGKINIGTTVNYPEGSNPLVPFQFLVFDATGPGGTPGTQIAGPFDFTPTGYGWNNFTFTTPVTITGGNFYIVQRQGGNTPDAAGIAIDATTNQLRSYMRFMPSGSWVNSSGNFLMRAFMYGPGGPVPLKFSDPEGEPVSDGSGIQNLTGISNQNQAEVKELLSENDPPDNKGGDPEVVTGYQVWRLLQGQEGTPAAWVSIGTPTGQSVVDNSWPTLPCNPYRWAVKTQYTGNRWSNPAFSNALGKCWTSSVTVNVALSCPVASAMHTKVRLQNTVYVDTVYEATLGTPGSSGTCNFPHVWKGTYILTVSKFGFTTYTQPPITIMGNLTQDVTLLQLKTPPTDLQVNNRSLKATWRQPVMSNTVFSEDWNSGSFATNGWQASGGSNWQITSSAGNPAPSAIFYYSPIVTNYDQYLTSKDITGLHSPIMTLKYDIYLYNWATPNTNFLSVEIWNGSSWDVLKTYANTADIPWTSETLDITASTHSTFKVRFHAYGDNSDNIYYWSIDNISIFALGAHPDPCLQGYGVYLNSAMITVVNDTTYTIPAGLATYGQSKTCCVNAIYGSGTSTQTCNTFTSHFLCPPTNLMGADAGTTANLSWVKPQCTGGAVKVSGNPGQAADNDGIKFRGPLNETGLMGYNIFRSQGSSGGPWVLIRHLMNPDAISASDLSLTAGEWWYRITGYYDLTPFGFPGMYDESLPEGPEPVYILVVPDNRTEQNKTISNGQSYCMDANQTITVAGNNTTFFIQNGGSATMIAGQKIRYLPTTHVYSGGYMHGYISVSGPYCSSKSKGPETEKGVEAAISSDGKPSSFHVYPNPTTGELILEIPDKDLFSAGIVEVYGIRGEKILRKEITGTGKWNISLSGQPAGIYVIHVIMGDRIETTKIIRL